LALYDTTYYVSSVAYTAVTQFAISHAYTAGQIIRQLATPAVNSERVFVVIVAGTSAGSEPAWTLTRGAKTVSNTATFQECTGVAAVNGDATNTATWSAARAISTTATLGAIIKRNNGASYQICSTGGIVGASEPSFSDTAGVTTTDSGATWTSLGPVGNFSAWGAPHARLFSAYSGGSPLQKFFVADNHAETQSINLSFSNPATSSGPTYTICVDHTAAVPPVEANYNTGATISTTGSGNISFQAVGGAGTAFYYQGISFSAGGGGSSAVSITFQTLGVHHVYKNCNFIIASTSASAVITVGTTSTPCSVLWDNCTVQFANAGQKITLASASFEWRNTPSAIVGATLPTNLITGTGASEFISFACRGVDFSALSTTLLSLLATVPIVFEDCKFHASVTRYSVANATAVGYPNSPMITVRCDSGATNYKSTRDEYAGAQTTETSITRVGGATDGTTPTSDKIVTNALATFLTPYRMLPLAIWNEVTGADVTVTVYGTVNSASLPNNDEIWMDMQYLGSSGSPIASFKSTSKSHPLAANAAVSSDGSTWNGGGSGAGWSPFKLVATLTSPQPAMKGFVYINVRVGKTSGTCYLDPLPTLT
jgi:hypothetical protein